MARGKGGKTTMTRRGRRSYPELDRQAWRWQGVEGQALAARAQRAASKSLK